MNCISGRAVGHPPIDLQKHRGWAVSFALMIVTACGVETSESADNPGTREYGAHYALRVDPDNASIAVSLEVRQPRDFLREIRFEARPDQINNIRADGDLEVAGESVAWRVPRDGGVLSWEVRVRHQRKQDGYDAWLGPEWGIFRAEDIIPRARTRTLKGATSVTTFSFELPRGWSVVTEYPGADQPVSVRRSERRFDQPTGWIAMGNIGVRRETIAGIQVVIAGPQGHSVRRMDMLALLNWTLPQLVELIPVPPERLTIVSAGDPMWRGGLSAPASLFVHAERPLISENATSTLLHEVLHTALSIRSREGFDWIVEGMAEYFGLELLRRGHAISASRYARAISQQADWARQAKNLCGKHSTGATTALAVTVLHALDQEILEKTSGASNLDDVLQRVIALRGPVDLEDLTGVASTFIGEPPDVLHIDKLPGCSKMKSVSPGN